MLKAMSDLDARRRAEIVAEERFRVGIRSRLEQEAAQASTPNFWGRFLLEAIVIGLGFLFIREVLTSVIWFMTALALLTGVAFLVVASLIRLIRYQVSHARKYDTAPVWGGYLWGILLLTAIFAGASYFFLR